MANYIIEKAQKCHLESITDIANSYSLNSLPPTELKDGFLVSGYTRKKYEDFIAYAEHFYILRDDKETIGFLLAFADSKIKADDWLNMKIKEANPYPFIVGKQLAAKRGTAVAHLLIKHFINQVKNRPIFITIVLKPYNQKSVRFHELFGFKKIMDIMPPDGLLRGVWKKEPN